MHTVYAVYVHMQKCSCTIFVCYFFVFIGESMKPALHQLSVKTIGHLVEKGMYTCLNVSVHHSMCTCGL